MSARPGPNEGTNDDTPIEATEESKDDVFAGVYGHGGAKTVTAAALRQGDTHVLYEGPPGSGKSAFLLALESNVPGVLYRDGDQITASKLRDVLKSDPPILLIDEIDALDNDAYDVLSTPMEHGRLVRDSARESYDVSVGTQIIAACNHKEELPEHIRSRFRILEFEGYSEQEYVDLCAQMLQAEIDWVETEEEGRRIANIVKDATGKAEPREARDTAQMASSIEEVEELAHALHNPDANVEAKALSVGDINRAAPEVNRQTLEDELVAEMVRKANRDDSDASTGVEEGTSPASNPGEESGKGGRAESNSGPRPGPRPEPDDSDASDDVETDESAIEDEIEGAVEEAVA